MKFGLIFTLQDPPHGEHLPRLYDEVFAQAALAELERTWWPHVKDYHLFYLRLGFFASGRFNAKWEPWVKPAAGLFRLGPRSPRTPPGPSSGSPRIG